MSGLSLNSRSLAPSVPSLALSFTRNALARRDSFPFCRHAKFSVTCQTLHLTFVPSLNPPVLFLFFRLHFNVISSGSLPFPSILRLNLQLLSLRHLAFIHILALAPRITHLHSYLNPSLTCKNRNKCSGLLSVHTASHFQYLHWRPYCTGLAGMDGRMVGGMTVLVEQWGLGYSTSALPEVWGVNWTSSNLFLFLLNNRGW